MKIIVKRIDKYNFILLTILLLLFTSRTISAESEPSSHVTAISENINDQRALKESYVAPAGPVQEQNYIIPVEGIKGANPGVYWVQRDDGKWVATRNNGTKIIVDNIGTNTNPWPSVGIVSDKIDMNEETYQPNIYRNGKKIYGTQGVSDRHITKAETTDRQGHNSLIIEMGVIDSHFIMLNSKTGEQIYTEQGTAKYDQSFNESQVVNGRTLFRPGGYPKNYAMYLTPLDITWRGNIVEQKKIRVTGKQQLAVNEEASFKGGIATQAPGTTSYAAWVDVTQRSGETRWSSDRNAVATVDPETGVVKALSPGTAVITAEWKKDKYWLATSLTVRVGEGPPPEETPGPSVICSPPEVAQTLEGSLLEPGASGTIQADDRGNSRFDVSQGIPTSESLYGSVKARQALSSHKFIKMQGECTFGVEVSKTYHLKWTETKERERSDGSSHTVTVHRSKNETVHKNYEVVRPYAYWIVDGFQLYRIQGAELLNYAFANDKIELDPGSSYQPPVFELVTDKENLKKPEPVSLRLPTETRNGEDTPDEDFSSQAQQGVPPLKVENDTLSVNGAVIMDGSPVIKSGPNPAAMPVAGWTDDKVLYSPDHLIPSSKANRKNAGSSGTITYHLLEGGKGEGTDIQAPINGINSVTVHTPVVVQASVSDDREHNQKTVPTTGHSALILDRPFTVHLPTTGPHVNYPGYGQRDYARYMRTKQVQFPFDVYDASKSHMYAAGTWIDIPVMQLDTYFHLPVWVDEDTYEVSFRTIAENAPDGFTEQGQANTDGSHHAANDVVKVEAIGRLYDFHVTDIADYHWESVFRQQKGSRVHSGLSYWTGLLHLDGGARGNLEPFTLPIRPGSHPGEGYRNVAVKTGYHFKFDLKTKGNMFGPEDGLRITPTFTFVSQDGSKRQNVDLYTHAGSRKLIQIGSAADEEKRYVILNERLRNVPEEEMRDTVAYRYRHELSEAQRSAWPLEAYASRYRNRISKAKTWIGRYSWLVLPAGVRTLIGPKEGLPAGVDVDRANAAIQRWYGEYSLPADVYVVPKGTDLHEVARSGRLDERTEIFLKHGYIVINMNIESLRKGDAEHPHLQYIHAPLMNQWRLEGFPSSKTESEGQRFPLQDGDVVFYHADQSSRDDFASFVPH